MTTLNKVLTILLLCVGLRGYGQKRRLVTLILTLDSTVSDFSIKPAPLKYNKDFAWSFTLDDGLVSAFLVAFPYLNGGQVAPSYVDQWGHDQGGDGLRYPGLFFTDGCGNRIPFRAAVAINGRSIVDSPAGDKTPPAAPPAAGKVPVAHPGNLSWQQIRDMYAAGWDVFNHGFTHATGKGVDEDAEVRKNNQAAAGHLGFQMSQFVVPGGKDDNISQEPYAQAAFAQGMTAVHCGAFPRDWALPGEGDRPGSNWPEHLRTGREFISSRNLRDSSGKLFNGAAFFGGLPGLLSAGKKAWVNVFTHSVGNDDLWGISLRFPDFKEVFDSLEARYGEKGQDNMWMASFQAVQEYLIIRQSLQYTVRRDGGTRIILVFDPAKLPRGLRHRTISWVWKAPRPLKSVRCQGCTVESFSGAGAPHGIPQIININWQ
jgi:hypothetical protein